ncbi:MAG: hypothetical protein ACKVI4_16555, partial [Actinomycetales bacterium]
MCSRRDRRTAAAMSLVASPPPPPPPFQPPPPPEGPALPGFAYGDDRYAITQELVPGGLTSAAQAADRCKPLAAKIRSEIAHASHALIAAPASCGAGYEVITCSYTASSPIIAAYIDWVRSEPLDVNPAACVQMTFARSGTVMYSTVSPPPLPPLTPSPPSPPLPPPAPVPSPP